ncbi:MAG: hypothetical protein WCC74_00645 [Minisyncoccia bacterium]
MLNDISIIVLGIAILGAVIFLISKNIKRTFQVMSGWGLYEVYNFAFDFLVWPIIQAIFGFLGIILLIIIALINNFLILLWYQKKKVDWFGVNEVEDLKIRGHLWVHAVHNHPNVIKKISLFIPAKILQLMLWLLNKNDVFAFVTLSVWQDSFITTIFLRHGKFDKLDKRDYIIFVSSTILSCLAWSVLMQFIIIIIKFVLNLF